MNITLDPSSVSDYLTFLRVKSLPRYNVVGHTVSFPDEYASKIGVTPPAVERNVEYFPASFLFDYQRDISRMAIAKKKFCVFADCGLGKQNIIFEFSKNAHAITAKPVLIVCPLMVVGQALAEDEKFYGNNLPIQPIKASQLREWLATGNGIGMTNYEAIDEELDASRLGGLVLDESSMLKSHYGAWGTRLIEMGRGIEYKLCASATPAPNDRIEYANHAVFMDAFPNVNSFLARFFVNRGQTSERWELKKHALENFYRALSHWCIFLNNPATYGWKDNCGTLPPINIHKHEIPLTSAQRDAFQSIDGELFCSGAGGIGQRGKIARIGKGFHEGKTIDSNKTRYIVDLIDGWNKKESTLVWCKYNQEQDTLHDALAGSGNIAGPTPQDERERIIAGFKAGDIRTMISKAKILGFGLNLQRCTRMVFSSMQDSYEDYYQCIKRANRYGSTLPLNVHIPFTELEAPMIDNVLRKAERVAFDAAEQERIFREYASI